MWDLKSVVSKSVFSKSVDAWLSLGQRQSVTQDVVQIVSSTIRRLRVERGFSQEEFAQHARLDRSFYGRVERGTQNIALRTLEVIAETLNVHPSELLADVKPGWLQKTEGANKKATD